MILQPFHERQTRPATVPNKRRRKPASRLDSIQPRFCDWVFDGTPPPRVVEPQQPPAPAVSKPLGFKETPARLTYRVVPSADDAQRKYCGACVFADLPRCLYCQCSKLSRQHRLAMPRLASLLLAVEPRLDARSLAQRLAKYARSDEVCAATNEALGYEPLAQAMCATHARDCDVLEEDRVEQRRQVRDLETALNAERQRVETAVADYAALHEDRDRLKRDYAKIDAENVERTSALKAADFEIKRLNDAKEAQLTCFLAMERRVHTLEARLTVPKASLAVQTSSSETTDGETQTECEMTDNAVQTSDARQTSNDDTPRRSSVYQVRIPPQAPAPAKKKHLSLFSKIGVTKCLPKDKLVPLPALLDMLHEVIERKLVNTRSAKAAGNRPDDLVDYVKIFWREKLGLRKLANKKVSDMIRAVNAYSKQHPRVLWFAVLLGVKTAKLDTGDGGLIDVPWVPWIASSTFDLLATIFDAGLADLLSNYKDAVVDRARVVNALIGSAGVLDTVVQKSDPSTWRPPLVADMLSPATLKRLVSDVDQLPEITAVPELPSTQAVASKGIAIDTFLDVLLSYQVRAVVDHQHALTAAFRKFDGGEPGLDIDEFATMCRWALEPRGVGDLDLPKLFARIEELADANLLEAQNDKNINDSLTFPIVLMQHVNSCPLAFACNCRNYWSLEDR